MFENWTMKKSEFEPEEYAQVANWCNETYQFTIEDMGDFYQVIPVEQPEPEPEPEPEVVENEQVIEDSGL